MLARCLVTLAAAVVAHATNPPHDVIRLADGVYAILRHDPESFANNANSLVVIGDSGVLVVDAQFTRLATQQTLAAIRQLTTKPVRFLVNTHWHDDHAAGNQVYRDTFPNIEIIAQANTRADLATIGAENRKGTWNGAAPFASRLRRLLDQGLGGDSTPATPREREVLENTISIINQYAADAPGFRETLPTRTFDRSLTIRLGHHAVELRWFGEASTRGDAIVYLPAERVAAVGDLLGDPVPFAFNAHISGWISALDSIGALGATSLVAGHGPVFRGHARLDSTRAMLARVRDETFAAAREGQPLEQIRRRVTLRDYRDAIARSDKWLNVAFTNFFLAPGIGAAYDEFRKSASSATRPR
jgi:cyclase